MKKVIVSSVLGSVVVIVVAVVTAANYVGALTERVDNIEKWMEKDDEKIQKAIEDFINAPRQHPDSMIEKKFNNPVNWGEWSEPVFCPPGYYVCGMKQQVELAQGNKKDDTAMNAVAFYCCPLNPNAKPKP